MDYHASLEFARSADEQDPLRSFRERFFIPKHSATHNGEMLYFTGNSLGLQPKTVQNYLQQELDDWAQFGVEGHFDAKNPWVSYHKMFEEPLTKIVGAKPSEVVAMNGLTVNLHLLMVSFYQPQPDSFKIICEAGAFPSDQYAMETQARMYGFDPAEAIIELHPRKGEETLRTEDIIKTIEKHGTSVALVLMGGVNYYTGQRFDMKAITDAGHKVDAFVGWDLAHAVGNVELKLHNWEVDFAVWCSYKYLNSGPGGTAGAFIHNRHSSNPQLPRFGGWWGTIESTRFKMEKGFIPALGAEGWQLSNAPVLSMAAHKASLDIFMEAGMKNIFEKRDLLTGYFEFLIDTINNNAGEKVLTSITPRNQKQRGCQLSLCINNGKGREVYDRLKEQGVSVDWREPNVIRAAPVPLYNSFEDVFRLYEVLKDAL
jgi:kynureninase